VAGDDVRRLVAQDRGELGLVLEPGQQPARHVDRSAGQGKGVDDVAVQDRVGIGVGIADAGSRSGRPGSDGRDVLLDRGALEPPAEFLLELGADSCPSWTSCSGDRSISCFCLVNGFSAQPLEKIPAPTRQRSGPAATDASSPFSFPQPALSGVT